MPECRDQRERIEAYLANSITASDLRELLAHAELCEDCRIVLELHRELGLAGERIPEPAGQEFQNLRESVLAQIAARSAARERRSPGHALSRWWRGNPILRPAAVVVLLVATVLAGRWSAQPKRLDDALLLAEIQRQAVARSDLAGYWDARFSLANVAVRPRGDGNLELEFDVCRRFDVVTSRRSPLAREALVTAILDSGTLGMRLRAMELAPEMQDVRLREALVFALHNDPEPAVRLEALSLLMRDREDVLVQDAILQSLRADVSVQVRLAALEALAAQRVDPQRILQTIQTVDGVGERAILQQAAQQLNRQ